MRGERHPVPQEIAQIAQLPRGDVGLRQQIGAQQVRQRARVDGVGLHPRGGDRLGPQGVREVQLIARALEQVGQPLPAVGRLERDPGLAVDSLQQLQEDGGVVDDSARKHLSAVRVDHRDVGALAMQVDTDRIHRWASSDPGNSVRPRA
jgi:hypothetical protein